MDNQIKTAIRQLAGTHNTDVMNMCDAEVLSINENERTCNVQLIGTKNASTITVRVMASIDDGCLFYPTIGSTVIIINSNNVEPFISMFSSIDKIIWLGGEFEGVPIVSHPTDTTKGLLKKINNLENLVNQLIQNFNTHTHITSCGAGAGSANPTTTIETTTITPITQKEDISHPNITH